ncbi:hypothetical protein HU200_038486 [Digitaria exilis]|uniref:Phytocyanin domain-containing protein n=1 Tax=Digitaria exilis TaxID=1010633 RepID=A0A835BBK0_9POAL|nr:hypothetical protein HU200_038486 [Digitaria exilis]
MVFNEESTSLEAAIIEFFQIPAMSNPAVLFTLVILALASTAAAGNATTSTNATAGNATASPTKNSTAPLPPFGTNHAVGDGTGWFFDWKANASAANYSTWAANRTFYLGDYLSFKTDTGNTVVHTTNATVYKLCSAGVTASGSSSGSKAEEAFLAVMLTAEGANYFFSDARDGVHCRNGMRFEVAVAHGRGLPSVPASYYEPLSAAPAGGMQGARAVAMWVALVGALATVLML